MSSKISKFYVGILMRDGQPEGHGVSLSPTGFDKTSNETDDTSTEHQEKPSTSQIDSFKAVFDNFISQIETYRRFMPITLDLAPQIAGAIGEREVTKFTKENGVERQDLSSATAEVYELDAKFLRDFLFRQNKVLYAIEGARSLPAVMIVGLISTYDSFLASLLRVTLNKHQEIVLTSQKQITFKELLEFQSIQDARLALIEREIESVLRQSHHDQFEWMQSNLSVKLREGLDVWPRFVELCERRNLFTHTGGIVSSQYVKNL